MRSLSGLKRQEGSGVADAEREVCNKCSRSADKGHKFCVRAISRSHNFRMYHVTYYIFA